jgi:hypothetical protein
MILLDSKFNKIEKVRNKLILGNFFLLFGLGNGFGSIWMEKDWRLRFVKE